MAEVVNLDGGVDAHKRPERGDPAVGVRGGDLDLLSGGQRVVKSDIERLGAVEPEAVSALALRELERDDSHHDEIRTVDPLVAHRDHGLHTEKERPLRRPVARRAHPVVAPTEHHKRCPGSLVVEARLIDAAHLAVCEVRRPSALCSRRKLVAYPDVGERASSHDPVVAPACAVGVEHPDGDIPLRAEPACRRIDSDRPGTADVVGRDGVAKCQEHPRTGDRGDRPPMRRAVPDDRGLL